jgi:hypothetical protein
MRLLLAVFGLGLVLSPATAQAFYECRDAQGRISFQGTPCAANEESRQRDRQRQGPPPVAPAKPPVLQPRRTVAAPFPVPEGKRYVLNAAMVATSDEWIEAFLRAEKHHRHGTLIRVFLDGDPEESIQLVGAKLSHPGGRGGGGRYRQVDSGSFVFVEATSADANAGRTRIEVASASHGATPIWLGLPEQPMVAAGGDLVLAASPRDQHGALVIALPKELGSQRVVVGPLVVGGPYGETHSCSALTVCHIGPLAGGPYKLLFPDVDVRKSRFDVSVTPGGTTRLEFRAGGERGVELAGESLEPGPASTSR